MRYLALMIASLVGFCLAAPPKGEVLEPFTPKADLQGSWDAKIDPKLPTVLIIGDSISISYTRAVRRKFEGKANVLRPMRSDGKGADNCGDTIIGLANIDRWLGNQKWDVIHFNWGLWDLCYRHPESKSQGHRDKVKGHQSVPPMDYEQNLEKLISRLQQTGAKLIWASTTVVPEGEPGRFVGDDQKYNEIAARVMKRHQIPINDLHSLSTTFTPDMFAGPGDVHFSRRGVSKLADQVAEKIATALPVPLPQTPQLKAAPQP